MLAVADALERCEPVVIARDSFPVDDAGARAQAGERLSNQREARGEVIAGAAVEPHAVAILACDNPEAIVLDFMQPQVSPEGNLSVFAGRHGAMKPAGRVRCSIWAK